MTPRERHLCVLHGETPDKPNVLAADGVRSGPSGGWVRRLSARGMAISHIVPPYRPMFFFDHAIDPDVDTVTYSRTNYREAGVRKTRHTLETPIGSVHSVVGHNPDIGLLTGSMESAFVKEPSDWRVINYIFAAMTDRLRPNYTEMERDLDTLGDAGYTIGVVDKTPFQRAWIELASIERIALDIADEIAECLEYFETQRLFHEKAAEITAGCPSEHILCIDNITNTISPRYYRDYCLPIYEIYSSALSGTGKILAVHFDGLFGHLKDEITDSPFQVIDSVSIPPIGDVSLREARRLWPDKVPFVNLPAHLAWASKEELIGGYSSILSDCGNKIFTIEHVEDMPEEKLELHLSTALDVCGY